MSKILEKQIHEELKKIITSDGFKQKIDNNSGIEKSIRSLNNDQFIPAFSIDYLARKKLLKCAEYILPKLSGLQLISSDKSISKEKGQILRPDLITYNAEENCFVVIEIKKDNQTAREAMTELLAYEQEIQNHMPFCSSLDILYVLVSPEWSTLLDHSIASAVTWSSHKILALNYDTKTQSLSVYIPQAWSRLGLPSLPKDGGSTITIFCNDLNSDEPPPIIYNALNLMKEFGDREHLSGFCFAWRDWYPLSQSRWSITVCIINPIKIYKESNLLELNQRENPLSAYIESNITDMENYYPASMFALANKGKDYLNKFCNPKYEGLSSWNTDLENNRFRSMPIEFRFFGALSEFTSDLIDNEGFWSINIETLEHNQCDFNSPLLAIPFIDNLFGDNYLTDGVLNISECAKIGILFSALKNSLHSFLKARKDPLKKKAYFLCIYRWYQFRLISLGNEIKILMRSANKKIEEPPVIKISDRDDALKSIEKFESWLVNDLIGSDYPLHQSMLRTSSIIGFLTDKTFKDIVSKEDCLRIILGQKKNILFLSSNLTNLKNKILDKSLVSEGLCLLQNVEELLGRDINKNEAIALIDDVVFKMPGFLDECVFPVHFDLEGINLSDIDWEELRNSYNDYCKSGRNDICINLNPNGDVSIATHEMAHLLSKNVDPESQFVFSDQMHGMGMLRIIDWSSIKDGSFFKELSDPQNSD